MKTIAQQIKWDFKANGNLEILDKNGKRIYNEYSDGYWAKWEYDSKGKEIYSEDSDGGWCKYEYDSQGNQIYYEDSSGHVIYNRPKPCEDKVVEIDGVKYKLVKQ
jgi:Fe-S cluster biosynthesis and repair protein YggX